jgi:hypothetical protein
MVTLIPSVAAVTVSTIFCLWQSYQRAQLRQKRTLHERVAFMLWRAAHVEEQDKHAQVCA